MRSAFPYAVILAVILLPMIMTGKCVATTTVIVTSPKPQTVSPDTSDQPLPLFPDITFTGHTFTARGWYEQGFALTNEGRYREALIAYGKALSLNRSLLNAWYYSGDAHFRLGEYHEALLAFENATAVDPDFVDAYFYESRVYDRLGRPGDEKDALRKGLEAADRGMEKEGYRGAGTTTAGGSLPVPVTPVMAAPGIALAVGFWSLRRKDHDP